MKKTQQQRILEALRQHPEGLSVRYIKREMGITECNGRITELRGKGYDIRPIGVDEYGFTIQQLIGAPPKKPDYVRDREGNIITIDEYRARYD